MPRAPVLHRKRTVERAIRVVRDAGLPVAAVRFGSNGDIEVITARPDERAPLAPHIDKAERDIVL